MMAITSGRSATNTPASRERTARSLAAGPSHDTRLCERFVANFPTLMLMKRLAMWKLFLSVASGTRVKSLQAPAHG